MAPAKGQRLDFMVLNHDEDLISAAARAQLLAVQGAQRRHAPRMDSAVLPAYALDTDDLAAGTLPSGKPDITAILVPQDLQTHAPAK